MNNKIKVSKFFQAGGCVQVELRPEVVYFGQCPILYVYDSDSINDIIKVLYDITDKFYEKFHRFINAEMFVNRVNYYCDGIIYEPDFDPSRWLSILTNKYMSNYYLKAVDKCYPKKY